MCFLKFWFGANISPTFSTLVTQNRFVKMTDQFLHNVQVEMSIVFLDIFQNGLIRLFCLPFSYFKIHGVSLFLLLQFRISFQPLNESILFHVYLHFPIIYSKKSLRQLSFILFHILSRGSFVLLYFFKDHKRLPYADIIIK